MPSAAPKHKAPGSGWKPAPGIQTFARTFRSSAEWKKVRILALKAKPYCALCDKRGTLTPLTESSPVHHIIPIVRAPHLRADLSNLVGLCTACHDEIEKREQRGERTESEFQHA